MGKYISGLVSVIIPTYKRSEMLERAINSVLSQTYSNIELIVVNDNIIGDEFSKKLYHVIENINDPRLIFLEQDKHINGAVARNFGIRRARGEYIAFLDDDDWWNPYKIETQINEIKKLDESWGGVSCLKCYYSGETIYRASIPYKDGEIFKEVLTGMTNITTGTVLLRHDSLDKAGYFDESLKRNQDVQLFSYFTNKYKIKLIKKYLHNVDVSDDGNRPTSAKIGEIKEAYFKSVLPLIENDMPMQKCLRQHISFTKGIYLLKEKNMRGLKFILPIIASPGVFTKEIRYYCINICEYLLKDRYLRRYGLLYK